MAQSDASISAIAQFCRQHSASGIRRSDIMDCEGPPHARSGHRLGDRTCRSRPLADALSRYQNHWPGMPRPAAAQSSRPARISGRTSASESLSIGGVVAARNIMTRGDWGTSTTTVRTKGAAWGRLYLSSQWSLPTTACRANRVCFVRRAARSTTFVIRRSRSPDR